MARRPKTARLLAGLALCVAMVAGSLTAAPPSGAATPENITYVRSLYLDLLDRTNTTNDDEGIEFWANRLEAPGASRFQTVQSIMRAGSEYYGNIVDINYALFLDRTAEPAGRDFYVQGWRTRRISLDAVVIALGESSEYYNRVGATNGAFVNAIYFDILGREPDAAGQAFALDYVAERGRGQYVKVVQQSVEKRRQVVNDQFGTFLGRVPTMAQRDAAVGSLGSGLRREDFDASLVASDEYYANNS